MTDLGKPGAMNEYGAIRVVAVRSPRVAFSDVAKIDAQWQSLRFNIRPDLQAAINEHDALIDILSKSDAEIIELGDDSDLSMDAIYARDATIVSPKGQILCRMGRPSRQAEPSANASMLGNKGYTIHGTIEAPGTVEGGDFIWISQHAAAVGLGPRTNQDGIKQLGVLLGEDVDLFIVPLPHPDHPEDVFHLMSMISPLDRDLALIYRPLMPEDFIAWLEGHGIAFVEVPDDEYADMACNVLALGPRDVVMLDRLPATRALLEAAGCTVATYTGDHISRAGEGGPTCLTRPLIRGD